MPEVVCNTSPLLYLHQLGQIDLLPRLYAEVIVPGAVLREIEARLSWLWSKHEAGNTRLGISPVRTDGTCRWGAIDLDAHGADDADRLPGALAVAAGVEALKLTPYLERSRGGKGWHVWIFLHEPGERAADLHRLLALPGNRGATGRCVPFIERAQVHPRAVFRWCAPTRRRSASCGPLARRTG
ncbi:MAG: hypothetical protein EXR72_03820 [Myxococcales bacterium]|nr:hypothetical protein [Myxococcales bacterium]